MEAGDRLRVKALKADGTCYRWGCARVEAVAEQRVVALTPPGHRVESIDGGWTSGYAIRSIFWTDRWYSLLEVYFRDEPLSEIFVNVNSPAEVADSEIRFTDYELDVSRKPPEWARVVDEDEFLEAVSRYGYTEVLRQRCYAVAREAVAVANRWEAGGFPESGCDQAKH